MKILHILNHTMQANGHVCAMLDLACTQARCGHEVYICSAGGDFDKIISQHGIQHVLLDQGRRVSVLLSAFYKLHAFIRKVNPDIVHAHMMTSAILAAAVKLINKFKLVTTVHNEFQRSAILMGLGQRVIGVSDAVSQSMIRRGISSSKMRTVLNGTLNSPRFPKPPPTPLTLKRPAIMFVGGLHPRKGVEDLINAFAIISAKDPRAHLYLIGSGPFKEQYEAQAINAAKGKITFCGHISDPRLYLLGGDIFVLPSHEEPAGLVLSEARDAGCAIVATNVGGIPEMVEKGKAGILVPPKRPDLIAEALLKLLGDPVYLTEMRAKSQFNIGHLSLERVAAQTEQVYRELLG